SDRPGHSTHADPDGISRLFEEGSATGVGHRRRVARSGRGEREARAGSGEMMSDRAGEYITGLFSAEDELLASLREEADRTGLPPIAIAADEGRLLQVLLRPIGGRRVLEVGTLGGYSAICMARVLPADGRLLTIEIEPKHADFARRYIKRAALSDRIEVRVGRAVDVLP